ncbi:acyltransferase [Nodosilinea sp. LEGE 06152]|uniref:acyltransferase family protein n=1 Tax=Nodosilinea sp. LEGE 06152 TaxID=2777966 RepID=UPI0018806219|nr:acyltransferase [Nodosilinea sp. LEGE 06152]MBE9159021.1 acyltransferase [Nodosilinea sp. LEGE 06152]
MSQPKSTHFHPSKQRLSWLEGVRILAAVGILLYHAQLLFTDYAYTPLPTGVRPNAAAIAAASPLLGQNALAAAVSVPIWFGFQAVDVFILLAGFVLVLSLRSKAYPISAGEFIRSRLLRILWPFWTVAWLAYPILWLIGIASNSYRPAPWDVFAGATFPLLFGFDGERLLATSGPWWFIPLVISFALISPGLWYLLDRWGTRNLLVVSTVITLLYRYGAVYYFGGHLTYSMLETPNNWLPFVSFLAKLSTFVVGMAIATAYCNHRGPLFWRPQRLVGVGLLVYALGFVAQFYRVGWVVCDLLLPIGLVMVAAVLLRSLSNIPMLAAAMGRLGAHSYSYFLIHGFVIDRTINLWVQDSLWRYWVSLPLMVVGTLVLAMIADAVRPFMQRSALQLWRDIDYLLMQNPATETTSWKPLVGDRVSYQGSRDWIVHKIETLLDEGETYLCQIAQGRQTVWVSANSLSLVEAQPIARTSPYAPIKTVV